MNRKQAKKEFAKKIGKRIKFARNKRGLTLKDVKELTGYTDSYISYIENSINVPSSYILWVLAEKLNVSLIDLYPNQKHVI